MPELNVSKATLHTWIRGEGVPLKPGDVIAQVETDKALLDITVSGDAVLLKHVASRGDRLAPGTLIALIGDEGENVSGILRAYRWQRLSGKLRRVSSIFRLFRSKLASPALV